MTFEGGVGHALTGGSIAVHSGRSASTTSGSIDVATHNAGANGVSGALAFASGTTSAGNSGSISIDSKAATGGKAGSMFWTVGTGNTARGGAIAVTSPVGSAFASRATRVPALCAHRPRAGARWRT
mgnify:CR=1 FL=1